MRSLHLSVAPITGARKALDKLATYYSISADDREWVAATQEYQGVLSAFLLKFSREIRAGYDNYDRTCPSTERCPRKTRNAPRLRCSTRNRSRSPTRIGGNTIDHPQRQEQLARVQREALPTKPYWQKASWRSQQSTGLTHGCGTIQGTSPRRATKFPRETRSQRLRDQEAATAPRFSRVAQPLATSLFISLDEYEAVVESVVYPHQHDPMVF